jgi:hypothetical protein
VRPVTPPVKGSDPLRTLAREGSTVTVAGAVLVVPWCSALEWLTVLRRDPSSAVLALADNPDDVTVSLARGDMRWEDLRRASRDALETETGRAWWIALRLAYTSAGESVLGELTLCGVDPARVSLGQWCAAVYRILTRNADAKGKAKVDFELELPPPGEESAWDDGNDFAAMAQLARQYEK